MATAWAKTAYWADEVVDQLDDFETWNDRTWHKRGRAVVDGRSVMVAEFKPYTWARIYREGRKDRSIFFTVGLEPRETPGLVIKLDYMYEGGTNLTTEQKELCRQRIHERLPQLLIPPDEWPSLNWPELIRRTVQYIEAHTAEYDSIVEDVWGGRPPDGEQRDMLFPREMPPNGYAAVPEYTGAKGTIDDEDLEAEMKEAKDLGNAGEDLVVEHERRTLRIGGYHDLAKRVEKAKPGEGFDVLSFKPNGDEKHIEVKTTRRGWRTPFFMSRNERRYLANRSNPVVLYRLYNYNDEMNTAECLMIDDIEQELLFAPTAFAAYPKRKA
jgi:hypothetical protein